MTSHDFMDLLTIAAHVWEAARPDIVTLSVVGYPEYLAYRNFQTPNHAITGWLLEHSSALCDAAWRSEGAEP